MLPFEVESLMMLPNNASFSQWEYESLSLGKKNTSLGCLLSERILVNHIADGVGSPGFVRRTQAQLGGKINIFEQTLQLCWR